MSDKRTVLITGATGQQGGAVARALIDRGHTVRALTRNVDSDAAQALAALGAELRTGDFNDPTTLVPAAEGTDSAFLVGTPFEQGIQAEIDHGVAAVDAAKTAGVGHVVYSSVGSADRNTGIPHFDSKLAVEKHLAASGLNYTISAPVWFMDNVTAPWMADSLRQGNVALALPGDRLLAQIAVSDIGSFNAILFEHREAVFGKRYDIASDSVTGQDLARIVGEASGRSLGFFQVPLDMMRQQSEDMAIMFEWFDKVGYSVDTDALRRDFPEVPWVRFADWAKAFDWSFLSATEAA
ncbi:NmrA/HSCARG family protein [Bauldia sp.]|uniref:NmrA/HSCARG family protein n=1 Tax=Bauldia sp. TaxID=2575872 RepID=UPI003BAC1D45